LQPPVTSSRLGPNVFFSTLFSNVLSLYYSLNVRDQVSHPYRTIGPFPGVKWLMTHFCLVMRLRICGAKTPLLYVFKAWCFSKHRDQFVLLIHWKYSNHCNHSFTFALFFCNEVIDWKNEPFFFFSLQQGRKETLLITEHYLVVLRREPDNMLASISCI
jgi:hypothetical protein